MSIELDKMDRRIWTSCNVTAECRMWSWHASGALSVTLSETGTSSGETGVIRRYAAILDGSKIGAGLMLYARIWFKGAGRTDYQ